LALKAVPHHLYGVCSPQYNSVSAGQWQKWAVEKIENILSRNKNPWVVRERAFILFIYLEGLSPMPTMTLEFLTEFEERVKAQPTPSLYARLAQIDPPLFYRFSSSDRQRILRALAIFEGRLKKRFNLRTLFKSFVCIPRVLCDRGKGSGLYINEGISRAPAEGFSL